MQAMFLRTFPFNGHFLLDSEVIVQYFNLLPFLYIFSLAKTADKMLKEAEHAELMKDEERAYVLFMKYFNVVTYMKKTADYKKDKVEALLFVCLAQ